MQASARANSYAYSTLSESKSFGDGVRKHKIATAYMLKTPINFTIVDNLLSNYMLETWAQLMRMDSERRRKKRSILPNRSDDRKRLFPKIKMSFAHNFLKIDNRRLYILLFLPLVNSSSSSTPSHECLILSLTQRQRR